jgi:hypothetical protein
MALAIFANAGWASITQTIFRILVGLSIYNSSNNIWMISECESIKGSSYVTVYEQCMNILAVHILVKRVNWRCKENMW